MVIIQEVFNLFRMLMQISKCDCPLIEPSQQFVARVPIPVSTAQTDFVKVFDTDPTVHQNKFIDWL